jgi:hypothetical protein
METAMREVGSQLAGQLVQREIAASDPQPVDQGQYKAAWQSTPVEGGAVVGNSSAQSVWIERGRGPGPVPLAPIREWVRRKGFAVAKLRATLKGQGQKRVSKSAQEAAIDEAAFLIARKIGREGIAPRWVLRRAIGKLNSSIGRSVRDALRGLNP